ncbi:UbiX family flavin prenyltransferase [Flavihumibacter sp. CACIAM 22H1]|uniref:UbiX family flavin prenyltransferase n=1 Tax=Flavihumibacter sp. CACIAM 22H1 TaxID=1812911 RepID=UPI0007A90A31|nr:UbiX family flavin prenyltransferase [Flavihumibacter sp. CACIAM 22H1]KYP14858.1 MAG: 3-octaprenyl-4-hydroxybenzoate carboxy-lyase [Flavihumibacter sp. CACIAM 22H1]
MQRIVIAITGASGSIYAQLLLERLLQLRSQWEVVSVIMTKNAKEVWKTELDNESFLAFEQQGIRFHDKHDFAAPFASGSGQFGTMIIIPCSMGTLGRIAGGQSDDLITRAADVILKERRKLICVARETPYNLVHIRNMETITLAGGIICPATPSFYSRPSSINELALTVVDRVLDLAGLDNKTYRWGSA